MLFIPETTGNIGLNVIKGLAAVGVLLIAGDFTSTFIYHVPEHVFGCLHCRIHHKKKQTFQHYAVLSKQPLVMLDVFLGALPYFLLAFVVWPLSPVGTVIALLIGEFHVVWRHTTKMGWKTSKEIEKVCGILGVVTPEAHWVHHENGAIAFGDIFTFFDKPAQQWRQILTQYKKQIRAVRQSSETGSMSRN